MSGRIQGWRCWCSSFVMCGVLIASSQEYVFAQITPDNTLPNNSIVTPNGSTLNITGGTQSGSNLFHSFGEFSVPNGSTASFNNAVDIQNIISRVTGGSVSNIDGFIRANGTANLFLINPNGIIFGQGARLNIGGSFVGTTANAIGFGYRGFFSASNPNTPELLTVNPSAFFFNQIATAPIQNNSIAPTGTDPAGFDALGLRVPNGKSLLLVGGNLSMDGGRLNANGGRVELGGLAQAGTVALGVDGDNLSLRFPENVTRADVSLTNSSRVLVTGAGGGNIAVNARNLEILGETVLSAGIGQGLGTSETVAGNITLNATGEIKVAGRSIVGNLVRLGSQGNGGNITIDSGSFSLQDGAQLQTITLGQGNAGNVTVNALDAVFLADAAIFSTVEAGGVGKGGNIDINAATLSLIDSAQLQASTFGQGNAGNVNINTRDTVSFDGKSAAFSTVENEVVGNGGDINITSGSLSVTNGAQLLSSTGIFSQGNAGNVNINTRDTVSFDGKSAAFSTVENEAVGNGGDINITSGSLSVTNGAQLLSSTGIFSQGNAGNVNINTRDTVSFDGGDASSRLGILSVGKGGNINITTELLSVKNGAQLAANTRGKGNAGSVNINARDTVSFDGVRSDGRSSAAFSSVEAPATGNGGDINITTGLLYVKNGAFLTASTKGRGNGGNITVNANTLEAVNGGQILTTNRTSGKAGNITLNVTDSLTLSGSDRTYSNRFAQVGWLAEQVSDAGPFSGLFANTFEGSRGQGGDLKITTRQLIVRDGAEVTVSSEGTGNAGSLRAEADSIKLDTQGKLRASTASGEGGNINLQVRDLILMRRSSLISAKADNNGNGGNITINAPNGFILSVPSENSDIIANAIGGNGGQIKIKVAGIYGLEKRTQLLPDEKISEINASSEFGIDGSVELITPEIDPNSGLVELPTISVDTEVAQGCYSPSYAQSKFAIAGRGGLPTNPKDILTPDAAKVDWVSLKPSNNNRSLPPVTTKPTTSTPRRIVEATGLVLNAKGQIILTANSSTATPHPSRQNPIECHGN